jgi:hypothetical protein
MKTRTLVSVIGALVLTSLATFAAPVAQRKNGSTFVSGVYSVTFNLSIASTLPAGSTLVCKAQIAPNMQQNYYFSQMQAVPVEAAWSVATISGTTATCAIEIPFSWTLSSVSNTATLAYEIDAMNTNSALPSVVRVSRQTGLAAAYPTSGGASSLIFNVTF